MLPGKSMLGVEDSTASTWGPGLLLKLEKYNLIDPTANSTVG
jgi:hypothetical protein